MENFSERDVGYMRSALSIAERGLGRVWPNPSVGCVVVKDGIVVGRARTHDTGRPHAEPVALSMAGSDATGSDMYVTLEPCAHYGKTPPCCDSIVSSRVRRVIVACSDTDQITAGKGIKALKDAGVEVQVGLCSDEARYINYGYFLNREQGRPMFSLKVATTLDANVAAADGSSKWITCGLSRDAVHVERYTHDAVLTGIGTVLADNPELTARFTGVHGGPVRIVLDTNLRLPRQSRVLSTVQSGPVWVFTSVSQKDVDVYKEGVDKCVDIIRVGRDKSGHCDLHEVAFSLGKRGITRVMVEAGGRLAGAFVNEGLCDRLLWFRSSGVLGGDGRHVLETLAIPSLEGVKKFTRKEIRIIGDDCLEILDVCT